jgi:hypothetical protein
LDTAPVASSTLENQLPMEHWAFVRDVVVAFFFLSLFQKVNFFTIFIINFFCTRFPAMVLLRLKMSPIYSILRTSKIFIIKYHTSGTDESSCHHLSSALIMIHH